MDERSQEFERLRELHKNDLDENIFLKARLEELKEANEIERKQLEEQMNLMIHSQAGQFAQESQRFTSLQNALQEEVIQSQQRIEEQKQEISWLRR